jgi:hypothetical protein
VIFKKSGYLPIPFCPSVHIIHGNPLMVVSSSLKKVGIAGIKAYPTTKANE